MKASIIKKAVLKDIPSASGMEIVKGMVYVVGDDSPYLYGLDHDLQMKHKVLLYEPEEIEGDGRIPKKKKADLECMAYFTINGYVHILVFGSGSKSPARDVAYLIKLPTPYSKKHIVWERDLTDWYDLLRSHPDVAGEGKMNLEGATCTDDAFILFNRGNKKGVNSALVFHLEEFIEFIQGHTEMLPFPSVAPYDLPEVNGVASGFSGATVYGDKLFFTGAVEDVDDPYLDGPVSESLCGWKKVLPFNVSKGVSAEILSHIQDTCVITFEDKPYKSKVESIAIHEQDGDNTFIALAVTDTDGDESEILMLEIIL